MGKIRTAGVDKPAARARPAPLAVAEHCGGQDCRPADPATALAVKLLGRGALTEVDFAPGAAGGVYLTPEGRKRFLVPWEEWLRAPTDSWRHALRGQAVAFRQAILYGVAPAWYHDTEAGDDAGIDIVAPRKPGGEQAAPGEDDERF